MKKKKNKGGRPTKYLPEVIYPKIEEYFRTVGREQTSLPSVEGLADYLGVSDDTLVNWSKKDEKFLATIKKVMSKQKQQLMNDGMYGGKEVNAAMAIFLLKVNHGMKDTAPQSLTQINVAGNISDIEFIEDDTESEITQDTV